MTVATALATGSEASPHLAEQAVKQALEQAGLQRAEGIILLLSQHFGRHAQSALLAAARAGGCMQVMGMTAPGLITETGWTLDQPAAAALILGNSMGLTPLHDLHGFALSFCATPSLPADWLGKPARLGLVHDGSTVWQQSRIQEDGRCEFGLQGLKIQPVISTGLKCIGTVQKVTDTRGLDLLRVDEVTALESLLRALPAEWKERTPIPIHHLAAVPNGDLTQPAIPLLSVNADKSITLAQIPSSGESFSWAIRQPLTAESELRDALAGTATPDFGLMFSCIGRGPLFYGHDDRDLVVWRERFPGVPLLGAYGGAQIAPNLKRGSQQWQNSAVLALCTKS